MSYREIENLIADHVEDCRHLSFAHMMVRRPGHAKIVAIGREAVPHIMRRLLINRGCSTLFLLLEEITGHSPYNPEPICEGWGAYDVHAQQEAWVEWWRKQPEVVG